MKILIVVDMQKDFIDGALGSEQARAIVPNVAAKIKGYKNSGGAVLFTQDTHDEDYLKTQEGVNLPVVHCVEGTDGWRIDERIDTSDMKIYKKNIFASIELAEDLSRVDGIEEIEICGLCTDICVVSNALLIKAKLPEVKITVDAACCAGATKESHQAALLTMKMCQINILE